MDGIKEYLFGVIAAAIICAIVSQLAGKDSFLGAAMKLITGVFMLLVLISPVMKLRIRSTADLLSDISYQADQITSAATASTHESISTIIKERTQAYILDKASAQGVNVSVSVELSNDEIPRPVSVHISGDISPYKKKILSEKIANELGIGTEAQIWN